MKFTEIDEAFRGDTVTSKARNNYSKTNDLRAQAIEDFKEGKIGEAEFMKALKKAGFGMTRSQEILKQAMAAKKTVDAKKKENADFENEKAEWRKNVAKKAATKKVVNGVEQSDWVQDVSRKLGRLILPH